MTGLKWHEFADKEDIAAHRFYLELLDARTSGWWGDSWLAVPRKLLINLYRTGTSGDPAHLWTGFEHVDVLDYETDGRVYIRLPQNNETVA